MILQAGVKNFKGLFRSVSKREEIAILGGDSTFIYQCVEIQHGVPVVTAVDNDGDLVCYFFGLGKGKQLEHFVEINRRIDEVKNGKSMLRFLGDGFKEKQIAKLEEEAIKVGALIEAPRWFYQQPRVQLLSSIRDYALDGSQQGDAVWTEIEQESLVFPIANMFETADKVFAQNLVAQIEKPLKDIDPRFLLEKFEGNRSITFDFDKGVAIYYTPAPTH